MMQRAQTVSDLTSPLQFSQPLPQTPGTSVAPTEQSNTELTETGASFSHFLPRESTFPHF